MSAEFVVHRPTGLILPADVAAKTVSFMFQEKLQMEWQYLQ
jgi:hypothetical protein